MCEATHFIANTVKVISLYRSLATLMTSKKIPSRCCCCVLSEPLSTVVKHIQRILTRTTGSLVFAWWHLAHTRWDLHLKRPSRFAGLINRIVLAVLR